MKKLNCQGLSRRDKGLMSCLVADAGNTIVSIDLSAGEPTVTAHYSQDRNYYDATFGMVGQTPYFDDNGLLKIDDIYLTAASFSPLGADAIRMVFGERVSGTSGCDRWLEAPDEIKAELKDVRTLHKILVLGIGYAMGPKKMVESAYNKGYVISLKEAREFYKNYWTAFYKVRELSDRLAQLYTQQGYLINEFGYRLKPDKDYKALNYFIQSTVSGIINCLSYKFFTICPEAQFLTVIHDELLIQVPTQLLGTAKSKMQEAVDSLNNDLNWITQIRTGWVEGTNWYDAK